MGESEAPGQERNRAWSLWRVSLFVLLGLVALAALALAAFVYRGERELEAETALLEQEDARDAAMVVPAPATMEESRALRELAQAARSFAPDHPITLRALNQDAELPRVDAEQLRSELTPWSELLQAFDVELSRLGSRATGLTASMPPEEAEDLAILVFASELRAVEAATRGDGTQSAALFARNLRMRALFESPRSPVALLHAVSRAPTRLTVLQLSLNDRAPSREELATLREGLGESPRFAEPVVLRGIWRATRADFLSGLPQQDTSPWMGAWRTAEHVRLARRCSEISREPMDAALTAYESHQDCWRYDYERSAFTRTHHRLAEVGLDLLIQLADDGTLAAHGRVEPPQTDGSGVAVEYAWDEQVLTVTPASSWAWPNRAVWQWRAPVGGEQAEMPDDAAPAEAGPLEH